MAIPEIPSFRSLTLSQEYYQKEYYQKDVNRTLSPRFSSERNGTLLVEPTQGGPLFNENWLNPPDCNQAMDLHQAIGEANPGKCFMPFVRIRDTYSRGGVTSLSGEGVEERVSRHSAYVLERRAEAHSPEDGHVHHVPVSSAGDFSPSKVPTALELIETGLALAIPEYALALCQHEGLHALFASVFGARVTSFSMLPSSTDGHFRFGDVQWEGNLTPGQKTLVYLAPKFGDLLGLSAYAFLDATGNIPKSKYAQLPLLLVATGMWVDLSKDIAATSDQNDVVRAYSLMGATTEAARLPYRFAHAALAVGTGIPVLRGYLRLFGKGESSRKSTESKAGRVRIEGYVEGDGGGVRGSF